MGHETKMLNVKRSGHINVTPPRDLKYTIKN